MSKEKGIIIKGIHIHGTEDEEKEIVEWLKTRFDLVEVEGISSNPFPKFYVSCPYTTLVRKSELSTVLKELEEYREEMKKLGFPDI